MRLKRLFHLFYFFSLCSFGQNFFIDGSAKDHNNEPIAFANVVLIDVLDDSNVFGTITDAKGYFKFEDLQNSTYNLKVSYLGFKVYDIKIQLTNNVSLQDIVLQEQLESLDGVVVTAKKPTIKRLVDRLVFNVENSTLSNGNVLDILKSTPGVIVRDEGIKIKQTTPTIYINDRRVNLSTSEISQLLEGTSGDNVKSIEVITSPPAKYEAEGGTVLNIVTKKNLITGYNGSVFGTYKQGEKFPKYQIGTSHFFKSKKLNSYFNYTISPRRDFRSNNEFVNFIESDVITSSWETDFERTRKTANQNLNASLEYEIDKNNTIGFTTNMLFSPRNNNQENANSNTSVFGNNQLLDSTFVTENRRVDETFNFAYTLDYRRKFKKEGEQLSTIIHYTNYDFSSFQNVDTDYLFPDETLIRENRFQTFSSQEIRLYTAQIDYQLPFLDTGLFEAGFKFSNIDSKSVLNQFVFDNDIREEDLSNSDTFLYDELIYALYSSFSKDWESWSLKLGLRGEYTAITGNSISNAEINDFDYLKLFPSFYVSHSLNENNEIYFNYNKRIYRPRYRQLNPFKFFINDNTFITGDPNLQPQIDNQFILGYTFNRDYTFELYYRYEEDPTLQYFFQDNEENVLVYQFTNTDNSVSYGLDFTTYKSLNSFWDLYVLSSVYNYKNNFNPIASVEQSFTGEQWSIYAEIANYFTLLKDNSLALDVSFNYMSRTNDGPTDTSFISSLDINLRKTFWDNKASINIGVIDALNTKNFNTTTRYLNQDIFSKFRFENRLFLVGFNYKFGNFRLRNNQKSMDNNERERLSD